MPQYPEYANITGILARKSAYDQEQQDLQELRDGVEKRIMILYSAIGRILDASPEVPRGDSPNFEDRYAHRVSPAINFTNGDGMVALQLREIKDGEMDPNNPNETKWRRVAVHIVLEDESVPYHKRVLFALTRLEIFDWKHEKLSRENAISPPFDLREPEGIILVFRNALGISG